MSQSYDLMTLRLQTVYALCGQGEVMADIGTDHGYLPCALVETGHFKRAYASDIAVGPIENAKKRIREQHLQDKVSTVVASGLEGLPEERPDVIAIAGMGGEMIRDILKTGRGKQSRLILQPMTTEERLRAWLYTEGYRIDQEKLAQEERRVYTVISVRYTGEKNQVNEAQTYLGRVFQDNPPALARSYMMKKKHMLSKAIEGNRAAQRPSTLEQARRLETVLKEIIAYENNF